MAVKIVNITKTQIQQLSKREATFNSDMKNNGIDISYQKEKESNSSDIKNIENIRKFTADISHHQYILKLIK